MPFVFSFLIGLILVAASLVSSSHAGTFLKETAFQENFYTVQILDDRAWIAGYYGTILHTKDRGRSWEIQRSPTRNALFRIRFVDNNKGWITGSYGSILHTLDGGRTWGAQVSGTTEHLFGLTWLDDQMGWVVGSRGAILGTRDGGRSWIKRSLPEDVTLNSVAFVDRKHGWIAGEFGVIFQTANGGESWGKQKSPIEVAFASGESRNLFALLFPQQQTGWAFGLDGVVLKTRGAGSRWEVVREKTNGSLEANHLFAAAASNGRLWTVGERGTLLEADLAGDSWRPAKTETPRVSLNDIAFGKDGFGLIVGNRGALLRTEDGGRNWQRLRIVTQGEGKGVARVL
jgi:photosystem II stability/assembly factor-like uncharacterized protein